MQILIIDVNYDHSNTMHRSFRNSLSDEMEVIYYGPGYSSKADLDKGLHNFIIQAGKIDLILVGSILLLDNVVNSFQETAVSPYKNHRYLLPKYTVMEAMQYSKFIEKQLLEIHNIAKVIHLYNDVGRLNDYKAKRLKELIQAGFYLMLPGEDFLSDQLQRRYFGEFKGNNNAYDLVVEFHEKVISMICSAVGKENYCFSQLKARKYEWVVPGNVSPLYQQRQDVYNYLINENYLLWDKEIIDRQLPYKNTFKTRLLHVDYQSKLEKAVSLIFPALVFIPNHVAIEKIALFREAYLESLRNSRCAYVDGSNLKLIVNKYFEVPAAGVLMIGDDVIGLKKLGFVPGVHMIEAAPDKVVSTYKQLRMEPEKMQEIANNGRDLVMKKHTYRCRARATKRAFEAIIKNDFQGSHWENGDFIVESRG